MLSLSDITSFDVIVVVLFLLFLARGTWIGFMRQVSFFLALVFSYMLAGEYTAGIMPYVGKFIENPKLVFFISFLLLFIAGALIFILLGKVLHLVMQVTFVGWFDRLLGFFLGLVKGVLVASFLYMIMSSGPSSAHELVKKSVSSQFLAKGAAVIQQFISDPELRQKFLPKTPAIPPEEKNVPDSPEKKGLSTETQNKPFINFHSLPVRQDGGNHE
jgi:membrane protein required for colicin V production